MRAGGKQSSRSGSRQCSPPRQSLCVVGVEGTPSYRGSVAGERPRASRDARAECAARGLECLASVEASMHATLRSRNKRLRVPSHLPGGRRDATPRAALGTRPVRRSGLCTRAGAQEPTAAGTRRPVELRGSARAHPADGTSHSGGACGCQGAPSLGGAAEDGASDEDEEAEACSLLLSRAVWAGDAWTCDVRAMSDETHGDLEWIGVGGPPAESHALPLLGLKARGGVGVHDMHAFQVRRGRIRIVSRILRTVLRIVLRTVLRIVLRSVFNP